MTLPLLSAGTQVFIIGITLLVFAVVEANKIQDDDPTNIDMKHIIRLRFQMFTAMFFIIGSMFLSVDILSRCFIIKLSIGREDMTIIVEQLVKWFEAQEIRVEVYQSAMFAGGTETEQNTSGYRVEWRKPDVRKVWTPKYHIKFDPKTMIVTDFGEGDLDVRNHPNWNL